MYPDLPERWPEEYTRRISWLWLVGHAAWGGKLSSWARLPQGEQAGPVSLLWCHSLGRKA